MTLFKNFLFSRSKSLSSPSPNSLVEKKTKPFKFELQIPLVSGHFQRFEYVFKRKELLEEAFIHSSYQNENSQTIKCNNERLEFLGDSVLGLILSSVLMEHFPYEAEGGLSKRRAALVNENTLSEISLAIGLDKKLNLGKGEKITNGMLKPRLLASVLEALIGAIYLDGGFAEAKTFVEVLFPDIDKTSKYEALFMKDYKSRFQEKVQKHLGTTPVYQLASSSGPEHEKTFEVQIVINCEKVATGTGKSKKLAEQNAAKNALETFRINNNGVNHE